jgi:hypothetical protein
MGTPELNKWVMDFSIKQSKFNNEITRVRAQTFNAKLWKIPNSGTLHGGAQN